MVCTSGTVNATKSEEANDSLDTFIRQAIDKEHLLPFSRTGDCPVQWIQLLHALDQPDLPGWPLMTPIKVHMQKCEKCSREFCSPINYRRHIRVHRRSLNVNKESHKNRDLLAAFWDKLSVEEAKGVVSFNDVMLKEIPGSSVIRALASSLRKPGVWTLPQVYVKAGSTLLDIIQAKPSRLLISSEELFSILDDASERTFLCAGTAESVQKYVFDGEAATNSLELKNLVASTSFLFEQQLVKVWVANKDAEALRCQKLLMEEEEALQKSLDLGMGIWYRQARVSERKKQKKLRQKEHKVKEQFCECNEDLNVAVDTADEPVMAAASGPSSPSDSSSNSIDVPANLDSCVEHMPFQSKESDEDTEAQIDFSLENINQGDSQTIEPQMVGANGHRHLATNNHCRVPKSQRAGPYGFHVSQSLLTSTPEPIQKISRSKDRTLLNGSKVWIKKYRTESDVESLKPSLQGDIGHQIEENNCEVLIGSISITVAAQQQHCYPDERRMQSRSTDDVNYDNQKHRRVLSDGNAQEGNFPFSSVAAKEFLAQRWKEAISANHVNLVLSSGPEPPGCSAQADDSHAPPV